MASTSSNNNNETRTIETLGKFGINDYVVYYRMNNYMLDTGFRLIDATSLSANDSTLSSALCELITRDKQNEKIFIIIELKAATESGIYMGSGFEQFLKNLNMQRLNMYLIHYPALPNTPATCFRDMKVVTTQTWLAVSEMNNQSAINAVGVHNYNIKHEILLTEVIAVGPQVCQMNWYANYNCSYSSMSQNNSVLMQNVAIKHLAQQYNVSTAQILMLWSIQRGAVIVPKLTNQYYVREIIELNLLIQEVDLQIIDLLINKNYRGNF